MVIEVTVAVVPLSSTPVKWRRHRGFAVGLGGPTVMQIGAPAPRASFLLLVLLGLLTRAMPLPQWPSELACAFRLPGNFPFPSPRGKLVSFSPHFAYFPRNFKAETAGF